jgi:DNA-binding XRE family transcriptional regulator
MSWIDILNGFTEKIPTKAHIELLKQQITAIEKERDEARAQLTAYRDECGTLRTQLAKFASATEFIEQDGVLWKRNSEGKVETAPYCPHCSNHPKMAGFPPMGTPFEWVCSRCRFDVACNTVTRPK